MQHWRHIQQKNFTSWKQLATYLHWPEEETTLILKKTNHFPLNLPLRLAQKISQNNFKDPILKQFLPSLEELTPHPDFLLDPVQDAYFRKADSKILQKYSGRALLLVSSACAMHCRYCFRKNFPYEVQRKDFFQELALLQQDPSLKEVILSGGDPLSLSNDTLKGLLTSLASIPHLQRIRFHTRFPIGIPERIDSDLLQILSSNAKQIFFVLHVNHSKELDLDIFDSMKKISQLGIPILTHTVLLKDVNDNADTLEDLFNTLVNHSMIPYYLFHLDRVQGSSHFEVSEELGKKLMQELSTRLPGYALPRYAKEEPGKASKTLIPFSSL